MPTRDNPGDIPGDRTTSIMAVAVILLLWATTTWAAPPDGYIPHPDMAYVIAQQYAETAAVSPATVKWPRADYDKTVRYAGERKYVVRQFFDSQNKFGAIVRTKFTAIVLHDTDDTWRVIAFDDKWY